MPNLLRACAGYLWVTVGVVWLVAAFAAKRTERTQSSMSRVLHLCLELSAFFLLFGRIAWPRWLSWRFLSEESMAGAWTGLAFTAAGIAFATAARFWIGTNWSARVTIKEDHQLIQNGPYSLVRHPIYSGFILAFLGTAMVYGEMRGLLGLALSALGWVLKLRTEEALLAEQFGSAYLDYKRRVKALVPFLV
jgi:protein-S-isoprenylcysteine O-methyltransferase Ste14